MHRGCMGDTRVLNDATETALEKYGKEGMGFIFTKRIMEDKIQ